VSTHVGAIVLAAGASKRLGQPKQLLIHEGELLLARAIRMASEAGAAPVVTVLGANAPLVCATVDVAACSIPVVNRGWEEGIASSIQVGLQGLITAAPEAGGALILTCDQPRLSADHLRALIDRFATQSRTTIVASAYQGVAGVPAIFPRAAFSMLRDLRGDSGARSLLMAPPFPLVTLPFAGGEVDIDLPEDLAQLE